MTLIEQWQQQLPESLAAFVKRAAEIKDIDLVSGVLPVAVLWPIRQQVKDYDGDASDAVHQIVGEGAGRILKIVSSWPDDRAIAARTLAAQAAEEADLRSALAKLIEHFDAARTFAEQFAKLYSPQHDGSTFNIEDIKAAVVNVGGVTTIGALTVYLNLPPPAEVMPLAQRRIWYAVGLIVLISALLGIYQFIRPLVIPRPRMSGDFNVAVAQFGGFDGQGGVVKSADAADLADSVYRAMNDQLKQIAAAAGGNGGGFDIQVLSPVETGQISGATREERAQSAQNLADQINADLIVYGNLRSGATASSFVPEFYLSDRQLQDAKELPGQYEFGSSIETSANITTNPAARNELRTRLLARTGALGQFVIGLSYYVLYKFDEANQYFQQAKNVEGWDDHDGKEVLYLFLGNTAGQRKDLLSAQEYYSRALELKPEYARARLGAAEVIFQRSHSTCQHNTVDARGLAEAIRGYQSALDAAIQPPLADIKTKTNFGLGRAYLCLSQALVEDYWSKAESAFKKVIADYEGGNQRVQEMAAESHANLGIVYSPPECDPDPTPQFRRAAAEYQAAINISSRPARQAFFNRRLGEIYSRLKEYDAADKAYATAISLDPDHRREYEAARQQSRQQAGPACQTLSPSQAGK
jgi:tetratricopeptide (TPR) repeat protein